MKKNKILKTLGLFGCAILLVAVSIAGTMAFMTDSKTVTNTFTVGSVKITLDEAKVDVYGTKDGTNRVITGNSYKLIPGHTYAKDPTIYVDAESENCWLFVKVVNDIQTIESNDTADKTIAKQMEEKGWKLVAGAANVYAYNAISTKGDKVIVFDTFTIDDDVNNTTLETYKGKTVVVTAYAIQADGFDTADKAWAAASGAFTPAP